MRIQVLGPGCLKCRTLAEHVEAAANELSLEYKLDKVTDINQIMALGVMMTPALLVDGQLKSMGKIPSVEEIKGILQQSRKRPDHE